ncbi:SPOR domain-containing protein [Bacteroides fragilis]|jgi:cell division septation protein DedD|uniref:SPOR domain-containing protein n=1 Tax=Bacteroides fragilis TaxID=817 RepID=A0A413JXX7_BACFG|nr:MULTISPECIES: SPOR domain-containing protein [Bacteroides]EKA81918.1 hypothetical protein HMPREF1205_03876 [Bacteroides fragilis HMW 616]MBU3040934.1 SPOR domain-containing protein [Bacteroides sp. HF-4919]MBY2893699.1 cell division protein [Bacteroides fragilis]MCE8634795.1 SPOR domain-containing protein [Bacteroides fragilis]MCE8683855.1 SPOR domain-containing protein [Bacteroides fragilis]
MIELAQHIEVLLLENDCVIVPGFGGFIAHYAPAMRVAEENIFLPPTRVIGFNPQLRLNDGVLVQSYMAVYDTNFSDATKMVEREVAELIAVLHEEGKTDLPNIGEIRYTIHNTYEFIPYDNKITTPYLYGLDSFEIKELTSLRRPEREKILPLIPKEKKNREISVNWAFLRNAVAMIAAVALFFLMSTPVQNTYVEKGNYARLLPTDLFEKIEKQSVAMTPVMLKANVATPQAKPVTTKKKTTTVYKASVTKPVAVKEVKVAHAEKPMKTADAKVTEASFPYHIIIASVANTKEAELMAAELKTKGYAGASVLTGDGKIRVSIMSCANREDANRQLLKLRENEAYKNAWMLAK